MVKTIASTLQLSVRPRSVQTGLRSGRPRFSPGSTCSNATRKRRSAPPAQPAPQPRPPRTTSTCVEPRTQLSFSALGNGPPMLVRAARTLRSGMPRSGSSRACRSGRARLPRDGRWGLQRRWRLEAAGDGGGRGAIEAVGGPPRAKTPRVAHRPALGGQEEAEDWDLAGPPKSSRRPRPCAPSQPRPIYPSLLLRLPTPRPQLGSRDG